MLLLQWALRCRKAYFLVLLVSSFTVACVAENMTHNEPTQVNPLPESTSGIDEVTLTPVYVETEELLITNKDVHDSPAEGINYCANFGSNSSYVWSPDGQYLVAVVTDYVESGNVYGLFIVEPLKIWQNEPDQIPIFVETLADSPNHYHLSWTSDSANLVILITSNTQLVSRTIPLATVINLTTSEQADNSTIILHAGRRVMSPVWSPDEETIAFIGVDGLNLSSRDGSVVNLMASENDHFGVDQSVWSPDGQLLAFLRYEHDRTEDIYTGNIYIISKDGHMVHQLTSVTTCAQKPQWSPDGSKILYTSFEAGNWNIYAVNVDRSEPVKLTESEGDEYDAQWSPDGSQIVFISLEGVYGIPELSTTALFIMNSDGSNLRPLINSPEIFVSSPAWSPDGQFITYFAVNYRTDEANLHMTHVATGEDVVLIE